MLPVELGLPAERGVHEKARHRYLDNPWVMRGRWVGRLLRTWVDVLDHIDASRDLGGKAGLLAQFPLGCLRHRFSWLHSAGNDVPVIALLCRSVHEQHLGTTVATNEYGYLHTGSHCLRIEVRFCLRGRSGESPVLQ